MSLSRVRSGATIRRIERPIRMAPRREWTEWHLTPAGWQRGATRVHGQGNTWADEPEDRVLSYE